MSKDRRDDTAPPTSEELSHTLAQLAALSSRVSALEAIVLPKPDSGGGRGNRIELLEKRLLALTTQTSDLERKLDEAVVTLATLKQDVRKLKESDNQKAVAVMEA